MTSTSRRGRHQPLQGGRLCRSAHPKNPSPFHATLLTPASLLLPPYELTEVGPHLEIDLSEFRHLICFDHQVQSDTNSVPHHEQHPAHSSVYHPPTPILRCSVPPMSADPTSSLPCHTSRQYLFPRQSPLLCFHLFVETTLLLNFPHCPSLNQTNSHHPSHACHCKSFPLFSSVTLCAFCITLNSLSSLNHYSTLRMPSEGPTKFKHVPRLC